MDIECLADNHPIPIGLNNEKSSVMRIPTKSLEILVTLNPLGETLKPHLALYLDNLGVGVLQFQVNHQA